MHTCRPSPMSLAALLLGLSFSAAAVPLTPQYQGSFLNGDGANSRWVQVADDWRGTIYGDQSWGTGIWGLADHAAVMGLTNGDPGVVGTLETHVDQINFADQRYLDDYAATWGTSTLAPGFGGSGQDNWASTFWGYVAITSAGAYNFGVLYDDGFQFSLYGADGVQTIAVDGLNARDRKGYAEDLLLSEGLYGFRLDAYDRLEAGVVQLSWYTPGATVWEVVPQTHLYASAVPEPSMPVLMLAGLAAVGFGVRKRRAS